MSRHGLAYHSLDELIAHENADTAVVCTPHQFRSEQLVAANPGKHAVLAEDGQSKKPATPTSSEHLHL